LKISKKHKQIVQMHPALDFVNGAAYVAVKVPNEDHREVIAIATSEGKLYEQQEEWPVQKIERGLQAITDEVLLEGEGRWQLESVGELQEGTLEAPDWEAWYQKIYAAFDRFLVVRDRRYLTVLSLYSMMTHFHPLFDALPLLFLRGPHESGKSRAAQVIEAIAFNGRADGFASEAVIRRMAHQGRYTQIFTECDNLATAGSGDPLARTLQAGCYKNEAWASLSEQQQTRKGYAPARFFLYCPRVICATLPLKSAPLLSRCIQLDLVKVAGADQKKLSRSIGEESTRWETLRDGLYRLTLLSWRDVVQARESLKANWQDVPGRTFDKWLPLASIAMLVSEEVLSEVTELAKESLVEQRQTAGDTYEAILFQFARWTVRRGDVLVSESDLWEEFTQVATQRSNGWSIEPIPLAEQGRPEWAIAVGAAVDVEYLKKYIRTPRKLMQELKRLDLAPKQPKETNRGNFYPLSRDKINGVVGSYLGGDEPTATAVTKDFDPFQAEDIPAKATPSQAGVIDEATAKANRDRLEALFQEGEKRMGLRS
jgi:hypothetical protein